MIPKVALQCTSMNYLAKSTLMTGLLKYTHVAGAKFLTHGGSRTYSQLLSAFCDESAIIALVYPIHVHMDLHPNLILLTVRYFCVIQNQPHYYIFPTGTG